MPVIHYEHHKGRGATLQTATDMIRAVPGQQDFMEISDPSGTAAGAVGGRSERRFSKPVFSGEN